MLYVYAIAEAVPEALGAGLYGAPLCAIDGGGIQAIASEHYEQAPQSGVEELWHHEEVVEALMGQAAVLPMRFGTSAASEEELEAILRSRREEFTRLLDDVRGAVELSVRVACAPPAEEVCGPAGGDPATPVSGTEYMRERGRALGAREDTQARCHEALEALSRSSRIASARLGSGEFKAAYLVEVGQVDAFASLVARLGREGEASVSCTGPWPPYSFVSGERR